MKTVIVGVDECVKTKEQVVEFLDNVKKSVIDCMDRGDTVHFYFHYDREYIGQPVVIDCITTGWNFSVNVAGCLPKRGL